jgi:NADPH:quinone reductase-like Zn-dependent oxidoreductase
MQAVIQDRYGSADVLTTSSIAIPRIAPDEVLIEVVAAGVDRGVWHLVTGKPYLVRLAGYGVTKPKNPVPGLDVSGRVVAIGDDVERFQVGDEVFGIANGAYAEFAAAKEKKLAHKPSTLSFEDAAVASISGITALQALTDVGQQASHLARCVVT